MIRFATIGTVAMVTALAGCSTSMGRLSVVVPQGATLPPTTMVKAVEAEDCGDGATVQQAVARALAQAATANALTDVEIRRTSSKCLTVKGNAVVFGQKW